MNNCWVKDGVQWPTMAAMVTLWQLLRDLLWETVRFECQTGAAIAWEKCSKEATFTVIVR